MDDLESYSRRPCMIVSGIPKNDGDLVKQVIKTLEETGIQKEELKKTLIKFTTSERKTKKRKPIT